METAVWEGEITIIWQNQQIFAMSERLWYLVNPPDAKAGGPFFNTLRPRQNGRHFADDTFKPIFLNDNIRISIKI